jgi:chromate transport protein ChrA
MINSILLINHEIDSAYWKEWELFKIPGGITGFLLVHFPLLFLVLYGLVLVSRQSSAGLFFSFFLCFGGIFASVIHTYFLKKGRKEFDKPISKLMLVLIAFVSVIQLVVTISLIYI